DRSDPGRVQPDAVQAQRDQRGERFPRVEVPLRPDRVGVEDVGEHQKPSHEWKKRAGTNFITTSIKNSALSNIPAIAIQRARFAFVQSPPRSRGQHRYDTANPSSVSTAATPVTNRMPVPSP